MSPDETTGNNATAGSSGASLGLNRIPSSSGFASRTGTRTSRNAMEWAAGDVIDGIYEVRAVLGQGGMGRVYRVFQRGWDVEFAVKTPLPHIIATRQQLENFVRECNTWVGLGVHENIVTCNYIRLIGGIPRVFAEFVDGGSLERLIQTRVLYNGPPDLVLGRMIDIAIQFARGIHFSHERNLIHQDVKPDNVLLTTTGVAKVADFGLANARGVEEQLSGPRPDKLSIMASFGGMTQAYCSPEQADICAMAQRKVPREQRPSLTRRTDIYSWGVSVLEMFTGGVVWYSGNTAMHSLEEYLSGNLDNDSDIPRMPQEMGLILRRCMAQAPEERPATMQEAADALRAVYKQTTGKEYGRGAPRQLGEQVDIINNQGVSLLELNLQEEGMALLERGLRQYPDHPAVTYNLNHERWRLGRIGFDDLWRSVALPEDRVSNALKADWYAARASALYENHDLAACAQLLDAARNAGLGTIAPQLETLTRKHMELAPRCLGAFACPAGVGTRASIARDKAYILSCHSDMARIHNGSSGKLLHERAFPGRILLDVCWDGDVPLVLTSDKQSVTLCRVDSGATTCSINSTIGPVRRGRFASSPTHAVCISQTDMAGICNFSIGDWELHVERMLSQSGCADAGAVALSPDGRRLAACFGDESISIWTAGTGQLLHHFESAGGPVSSIIFTTDSQRIFAGTVRGMICVWNVQSGALEFSMSGHRGLVHDIALAGESGIALSASADHTVRVWSLKEQRCVHVFDEHRSDACAVSISQGERWAVSLGADNVAKMMNLSAYRHAFVAPRILRKTDIRETMDSEANYHRQLAAITRQLDDGATDEAWSGIEQLRQSSGYARTREVRRLCVRAGQRGRATGITDSYLLHESDRHQAAIQSVGVTPDGRHAISVDSNREFYLWDIDSCRCIRGFSAYGESDLSAPQLDIDGIERTPSQFSVIQSGRAAAMTLQGLTLTWWDFGKTVKTSQLSIGRFQIFDIGAECPYMAAGGKDGRLALFRHGTSALIRAFQGHRSGVTAIRISRTGLFFASASQKGDIRVWLPGNILPQNIFTGHTGAVHGLRISRCERYIISAGDDCTVRVWDVRRGVCVAILTGHASPVRCADFTPDGQYAVSGGADGAIRLWNIAEKSTLQELRDHRSAVTAIDLSPNGRTLVSGSEDGALKIRELDYAYQFPKERGWDNAAQPTLECFVLRYTPWQSDRERAGSPEACMNAVNALLHELQCAGFGHIHPDSAKEQLAHTLKRGVPPTPRLKRSSGYPLRKMMLPLIIARDFISDTIWNATDSVVSLFRRVENWLTDNISYIGMGSDVLGGVFQVIKVPLLIVIVGVVGYLLFNYVLSFALDSTGLTEYDEALRDGRIKLRVDD